MSHDDGYPLYGRREAACLSGREAEKTYDRERFQLLAKHATPCRRLVDIGCGWGQFLSRIEDRVEEIWGVDECLDRIRDLKGACPQARMTICRANRLSLSDAHFDVVVTSQMLHEVKLFGREGELADTLSEIHRILAPGGRWLFLDHLDAGDGEVVVRLPDEQIDQLDEFASKFRFYSVSYELKKDGLARMSRRCLQDFLTKDHWLNTDMEAIEMNETHNAFGRSEMFEMVGAAGFTVGEWIHFTDIRDDLDRHGAVLVEGAPWPRKFLLVAQKQSVIQT